MKNGRAIVSAIFVLLIVSSVTIWHALATEATNINSESKFAWSENTGWLNFASSNGGVMVTDTNISGYIWSENLGWISLNCSNSNSCAVSNYEVANDGEGNLSGFAWSDTVGWINFSPTNGGVKIDSGGIFSGYAWGENFGWIVFNCQDLDVCTTSDFKVKTTWLPISVRNQNSDEEQDGVEVFDVNFSATDAMIVINWDTNHNADSHISWGTDKNLEKEKNNNNKEEKHRIVLRDLESNTKYYFRVKSTDGNDKSDSSRIYSVLTKSPSAIFAKRSYQNLEQENYETVDIQVSDRSKNEEKLESLVDTLVTVPEKVAENIEPSQKNNWLFSSFSFISEKSKNIAFITWNGIAFVYNEIYVAVIDGQRQIAGFIMAINDQLASVYESAISKFNKEKATEIARLKQSKFFTTQVFSRNEKKLLAEVRFQILDKSDNPVVNLEATLFSDPQTAVTDDNGVASFKDVLIGSHTLAFDYQGENFEKKVSIADTVTDEGKVRAEVVEVKAEKEKLAWWMWTVMILLIVTASLAIYFARKYYLLKIAKDDKLVSSK